MDISSLPLIRKTCCEGLSFLVGGLSKVWVEEEEDEEVALEPTPLFNDVFFNRTELERKGLLEAELGVDVEGEGGATLCPWTLRSSGLSERNEVALRLKSSVRMSVLSRSMGDPLDSEYSTPKWRRWARAWLERPLRVSNQAPHNLHMMSVFESISIAMSRGKESGGKSRQRKSGEKQKINRCY